MFNSPAGCLSPLAPFKLWTAMTSAFWIACIVWIALYVAAVSLLPRDAAERAAVGVGFPMATLLPFAWLMGQL